MVRGPDEGKRRSARLFAWHRHHRRVHDLQCRFLRRRTSARHDTVAHARVPGRHLADRGGGELRRHRSRASSRRERPVSPAAAPGRGHGRRRRLCASVRDRYCGHIPPARPVPGRDQHHQLLWFVRTRVGRRPRRRKHSEPRGHPCARHGPHRRIHDVQYGELGDGAATDVSPVPGRSAERVVLLALSITAAAAGIALGSLA